MQKPLDRRTFLSTATGGLAAACIPALAKNLWARPKAPAGTGYSYDPRFARFYQSPEVPDRVVQINDRLQRDGITTNCTMITPVSDPMTWISKVHTASHIQTIQATPAVTGYEPVGPIAELAVGHVLGAVKAVCEGTLANAFCCIRPPGHHAINAGSTGYCYYGNMAIAARYAKELFKINRILVVDWDAHHGNGTQGLTCGDASILLFDVYYWEMSPNPCNDFVSEQPGADIPAPSGDLNADQRINVLMPAGSTNDDYLRLFDRKLVPAAEWFKPELVLISCGFDLKKFDTHSSSEVTSAGISQLTRKVMDIAQKHCGGRIVSMLEGGYADSLPVSPATFNGLSACAAAHLKTLLTGEVQPEDGYYSGVRAAPQHGMRERVRLVGTVLRLPAAGVLAGPVKVSNAMGQIVRVIPVEQCTRDTVELADAKLPSGRYTVTVKIKNQKTVVLGFEVVK